MKSLENQIIWVGVGPGDPELITMKGLRAIQLAEAILYDEWIAPELLEHASPKCEKIVFGKSVNGQRPNQDEIHSMIVGYAYRCKRVVRLTSGDPHILGRAYEEAQYVKSRGFHTQIIPGISCATAGPCAAGIPLTLRGINESFCVIEGKQRSGKFSDNFYLAAQSTATIIILMGLPSLKQVASLVSEYRGPAEPIAVIERATTKLQRVIRGVADDIYVRVKEAALNAPAIIVVGQVVDERLLIKCNLPDTETLISEHSLALPLKS